jgi:hypothetical protein
MHHSKPCRLPSPGDMASEDDVSQLLESFEMTKLSIQKTIQKEEEKGTGNGLIKARADIVKFFTKKKPGHMAINRQLFQILGKQFK